LNRKNISSASPLEKTIGFSRAVRVDNLIAVSGTAPISVKGTTLYPDDLYNQAKTCFEIMKNAIENAGGKAENIIRTRIYLTNIKEWEKAAKAHGEFFSDIRPACTFIEVNRFIDSEWLIETEADCIITK